MKCVTFWTKTPDAVFVILPSAAWTLPDMRAVTFEALKRARSADSECGTGVSNRYGRSVDGGRCAAGGGAGNSVNRDMREMPKVSIQNYPQELWGFWSNFVF